MTQEKKREYHRKRMRQVRKQRRMIRRLLGAAGIVVISGVCIFFWERIAEKQEEVVILTEEEKMQNHTYNQGSLDEDYDLDGILTASVSGNDLLHREILLVNKDNRLPEDYEVTLLTLPDRVNRAAEEAYEPLCDMLKAGQKEGLSFEICSSYRDVERQQELLDEDINILMKQGYSYEEAYEEVTKETMPPGYSEHSTGLAFDIVSLGYQMLDDGQEKTKENKWLQEHCAEYGFILRYPKGKEDITSINYESWHFRYVGKEAAEYIMENGITLEEYLEL